MKKILFVFIAVCFIMEPAWAEYVKPETAAQYARSVLGMKEAPVPEVQGALRAAGRDGQGEDPEYYVFNNPDGGWVIIAADDRVNPVIGYSLEGSFPIAGMPDNVQWWMNGVAEMIDSVRQAGQEVSEVAREAWESLTGGGSVGAENKELSTAKWDQGEPFNNLCPVTNGDYMRSLTGCVATAMAITMRYNRWPAHGKGVIGGYTTQLNPTYIPAYSIENHTYDWDNMPRNNGGARNAAWTAEQKNQVATLMHDCGVAVKMDYTAYGSGTYRTNITKAMIANMSYSESAELLFRASYTLDRWFSIMRNEIDHNRVIIYGGEDSDAGGHAFVCDGYDTDGSMLHINWGWGGKCNGYFSLDMYVSDYDYKFTERQDAVIGLAPDTVNVELEEKEGAVCILASGFYGIEPLIPTDITLGSELNFYAGWFYNHEDSDVTYNFKVCLEDKEGNIKQEGWYMTLEIPAANAMYYSNKTEKTVLTVSPEITDHFRLYIKEGEGDWKPMHGNYDILPDVDGVICGVIQDPVIIVPDGCVAGQEIDLSLSLGFTHVVSEKWIVNGKAIPNKIVDGKAIPGIKAELKSGNNDIRVQVEYLDGSNGTIWTTVAIE